MKTVELRNILVVVMSVFIALSHGISRANKKLEAKSCECAHTGKGGNVECLFVLGVNMAYEGSECGLCYLELAYVNVCMLFRV